MRCGQSLKLQCSKLIVKVIQKGKRPKTVVTILDPSTNLVQSTICLILITQLNWKVRTINVKNQGYEKRFLSRALREAASFVILLSFTSLSRQSSIVIIPSWPFICINEVSFIVSPERIMPGSAVQ